MQQRARLPAWTQPVGLPQGRDGRIKMPGIGRGLGDRKTRFRQGRIVRGQTFDQFKCGLSIAHFPHQRRQVQKAVFAILFQQGPQDGFSLAEAALIQQQRHQRLLRTFRILLGRYPQTGGLQCACLVTRKHRNLDGTTGNAWILRLPRQVEIGRLGNANRATLTGHLGHQKLEQDFGGERLPGQGGLGLGQGICLGIGDNFCHCPDGLLRLRLHHHRL